VTLLAVASSCSAPTNAPAATTLVSTATPIDEARQFDLDARALIPMNVDARILGTWSCRGISWMPASYALTYRPNRTGTETERRRGKRRSHAFLFGTQGSEVIDYAPGEYPSRARYSFGHGVLTIRGNSFWKEGDGWFATPELDESVCQRAWRTGTKESGAAFRQLRWISGGRPAAG